VPFTRRILPWRIDNQRSPYFKKNSTGLKRLLQILAYTMINSVKRFDTHKEISKSFVILANEAKPDLKLLVCNHLHQPSPLLKYQYLHSRCFIKHKKNLKHQYYYQRNSNIKITGPVKKHQLFQIFKPTNQ